VLKKLSSKRSFLRRKRKNLQMTIRKRAAKKEMLKAQRLLRKRSSQRNIRKSRYPTLTHLSHRSSTLEPEQ